ncbi:MAG: hypothetical protein ABJA74_02240 [Lapillicoccus sp.]
MRATATASGSVSRAVGRGNIPAEIRALTSVERIDYGDWFTLSTEIDATPEQWARAMFGAVPNVAERLIWRGLLGMRLRSGRSPATVAGWPIGAGGHSWVRLDNGSWFLTAHLLVDTADGRVSLGTFVQYDRPVADVVWPALSVLHRRLVPGLLLSAATALGRG